MLPRENDIVEYTINPHEDGVEIAAKHIDTIFKSNISAIYDNKGELHLYSMADPDDGSDGFLFYRSIAESGEREFMFQGRLRHTQPVALTQGRTALVYQLVDENEDRLMMWTAASANLEITQISSGMQDYFPVLVENEQGKLKQCDPLVSTSDGPLGHQLVNYHRTMMKRASEAIERVPREQREISSVTLCIDEKQTVELKKKLENLRLEIVQTFETRATADRIVQVNFQMFPLGFERCSVLARMALLMGVTGKVQSQNNVVYLIADEILVRTKTWN